VVFQRNLDSHLKYLLIDIERILFTPIEIVLTGHFVPGVGLRRHPEVGEGRAKACSPRRLTSVSA